ncbi:MAG TPA: GNAT family N-acetyltransferase [Cyclobacteriaceae bacterium]|nr:GNAT family N-acetyltransferase [Cyclobacteriaceae bacterium]
MIEIRSATFSEIPELRRIAIETQIDTFGEANTRENMDEFIAVNYNLPQLQKEWSEAGSLYTMAWEGEKAAGFSRLRLSQEANHLLGSNTIELQRLYVTKEFQGRKVGALLMQHAIDYSRGKGFDWLWLGVWEHNIKAQQFYSKWGFSRFSEHTFYMGQDAQTDWLLKLKL